MKIFQIIAVVLIVIPTTPVFSQAPDQINSRNINSLNIHGPLEAKAGQLVRLTAELQPNESPFWIVLKPADLDYEQTDRGRRLMFAVGCDQPNEIVVLLLAQSVVNDRIVTRQLRRRIEIVAAEKKPTKPPDKNPEDPPTKDPPLENSPLFAAVQSAWREIPSLEAKAKSNQIAANFEATAADCVSGKFEDISAVWKTLAARNSQVLGSLTNDWQPVGSTLQQAFKKLNLTKAADHAMHLEAAAAGIRIAFQSERLRLNDNLNRASPSQPFPGTTQPTNRLFPQQTPQQGNQQ